MSQRHVGPAPQGRLRHRDHTSHTMIIPLRLIPSSGRRRVCRGLLRAGSRSDGARRSPRPRRWFPTPSCRPSALPRLRRASSMTRQSSGSAPSCSATNTEGTGDGSPSSTAAARRYRSAHISRTRRWLSTASINVPSTSNRTCFVGLGRTGSLVTSRSGQAFRGRSRGKPRTVGQAQMQTTIFPRVCPRSTYACASAIRSSG